MEDSEFMNEDSKMGMNGKAGSWNFEEIIDLGVHTKGRPLMKPDICNQGLIDCGVGPEGPRVAFDDKSAPVNSLHPVQPIEALSGEDFYLLIEFLFILYLVPLLTLQGQLQHV